MGDDAKQRAVGRQMGFGRTRSPFAIEHSAPSADATVIESLGLRSGMRVALVGVVDAQVAAVRNAPELCVSAMVPFEPVDVLVLQAEGPFALRRIGQLAKLVKARGSLWVLWPSNGGQLSRSNVERACAAAAMNCTWTTQVTPRLAGVKAIHRFADSR